MWFEPWLLLPTCILLHCMVKNMTCFVEVALRDHPGDPAWAVAGPLAGQRAPRQVLWGGDEQWPAPAVVSAAPARAAVRRHTSASHRQTTHSGRSAHTAHREHRFVATIVLTQAVHIHRHLRYCHKLQSSATAAPAWQLYIVPQALHAVGIVFDLRCYSCVSLYFCEKC